MSTSLLYHAFGIRGYHYVKTAYEGGQVIFTISPKREDMRCAACGSARVIRRGFEVRGEKHQKGGQETRRKGGHLSHK
jgi:hypothetical protein